MSFLNNIGIKNKHLIILLFVILGLVLTTSVSIYESKKIMQLNNVLLLEEQVNTDVLKLRKFEKDFLVRKNLKYVDGFINMVKQTQDDISALSIAMTNHNLSTTHTDRLSQLVGAYSELFKKIVDLKTEIGLDPKSGLYADLRSSAHKVEALAEEEADYEILFYTVKLRRFEKDFMLRRDKQYLVNFEEVYTHTLRVINDIRPLKLAEMEAALSQYRTNFNDLVAKEIELGLDAYSGSLLNLRKTIHQTEESFAELVVFLNAKINQAVQTAYITLGTLIILIFALIAGLMSLISRAIYAPVQTITERIQTIADDLDLTRLVNHISEDEVGILSKSFDALIASLRDTVNQVQDGSIQVAQASEEMSSITKEVGNASEQQQQEIEQAVTAINEMTATIQSIAASANGAAEAVKDVTTEIGRGKTVSGEARSEIVLLNSEVEGAVKAIEVLQKDSENIGDILSTISAIAEQTNLLALNAAIEAARAGEQGRGFAVVADEVRTLASRTQKSTESIRENINQFQKGTAEVVATVIRSRDRAQTGITKVVESSEILDSIYINISNISDMNTQIATASEEQGYASEEINRNVVRINELAHVCREQANQAADASGELAKLGSDLQGTIQRFKV